MTDSMITSAALGGGTIEIRDGIQPATPETTATGNLLVVLTFNATAFGASVAGVATANAIVSGVGAIAGTATWARLAGRGDLRRGCRCSAGSARPSLVVHTEQEGDRGRRSRGHSRSGRRLQHFQMARPTTTAVKNA